MSLAPLLLAIETATAAAGVALLRGDAVVAARALPGDRPASETLLPTLIALLGESGVALPAIEVFAVSAGPGSFTGLRVGVATVKGLAFGSNAVVVSVPTLAALARRAAPAPGPIVALLDARRGEVYAAVYDRDPAEPPCIGPVVLRPDALGDLVATFAPDATCTLIGEGVLVVSDLLSARFGDRLRWRPPPAGLPDPVAVGRLGLRLLAAGAGTTADALAPVYVRRAEAEVQRTGERFEAPRTRFDTPGNVS